MTMWLGYLALAAALSADTFAVSASVSSQFKSFRTLLALRLAIIMAIVQALFALGGVVAGNRISTTVEQFDHWIAFGLLAAVGSKMLYDSLFGSDEDASAALTMSAMFVMAVATSIDSIMACAALGLMDTSLIFAVPIIGVVTFLASIAGSFLGSRLGPLLGSRAGIAGGIILILLGSRILYEHLS
ncbi:MAG: manganese efflux pump MntP family protein [Spirochaetia bacterium]|nr:manganese efflux pump MntP family protein [Spirochaetia bacterium]